LNFGNPERPEIMWQFARAVEGIGVACRALDIPITGGNVSLYNETDGKAVLPTPILGMVGLIEDVTRTVGRSFRNEGDAVILLGTGRAELGGSEYLKVIHGLVKGVPPALDLGLESALQRLLVSGVSGGLIKSAHDCAEGGFAVTLAECCFGTGMGAAVDIPALDAPGGLSQVAALFGETASRVIVSVDFDRASEFQALARQANVPATVVGRVGGERIRIATSGQAVLDEPLAEIEPLWSEAIDRYFVAPQAVA
jgi:phosphoribosylformylglycinamidine synthase